MTQQPVPRYVLPRVMVPRCPRADLVSAEGTGFTPVGTSNGGKLAATLLQHTRLYGFAELRPDIRAVDHAVAL